MAVSIKHSFNSTKADGADSSLVKPSDWNADHVVTGLATSATTDTTNASNITSGTLDKNRLPTTFNPFSLPSFTATTVTDNPLTSGATTINVGSTSNYPSSGSIFIENEAIIYTGTTGTSFTGCTRGAYGTTAASHASGKSVGLYVLVAASSTAAAPQMVISHDGRLAFGQAIPSTAYLDFAFATTAFGLRLIYNAGIHLELGSNNGAGSPYISGSALDIQPTVAAGNIFRTSLVIANSRQGILDFKDWSNTVSTRWDTWGRYGLGTVSPASVLHINRTGVSATTGNGLLRVEGTIQDGSTTAGSTTTFACGTRLVAPTYQGGSIVGVTITSGGSGYSSASPPNVTVTGGGGSGAQIIPIVNGSGVVTGVTIVNGGSGYTSAPTVTFGAGTTTATGTPIINGTGGTITATHGATLYIDGPPTAGTNAAITNPWAMYVAAGNAFIAGTLQAAKYATSSTSVFWSSGTGSPEGVVTASVGSLYTRTDGGASTTLYVKESGTGNTGWIAK